VDTGVQPAHRRPPLCLDVQGAARWVSPFVEVVLGLAQQGLGPWVLAVGGCAEHQLQSMAGGQAQRARSVMNGA
jgi:hypothetical protein